MLKLLVEVSVHLCVDAFIDQELKRWLSKYCNKIIFYSISLVANELYLKWRFLLGWMVGEVVVHVYFPMKKKKLKLSISTVVCWCSLVYLLHYKSFMD